MLLPSLLCIKRLPLTNSEKYSQLLGLLVEINAGLFHVVDLLLHEAAATQIAGLEDLD